MALLVIGVCARTLDSQLQTRPQHSREFWRTVIQHDAVPPAGTSIEALSHELSDMLASPDPEWRDDTAYTLLASWIYRKRLIEPDTLRALMAEWTSNLTVGINDPPPSDSVFRRSFSALMLSVVVARDNEAPFLDAHEFRQLLTAALVYLRAEPDQRGYDPVKGWIHSAAHTADLLKFLGRSRYLEPADQIAILDGIDARLRSAHIVFTHGEDERLARAILSLVNRSDADRQGFRAWLDRVRATRIGEPPAVDQLTASQNIKNLLAKLEVVLSVDPPTSEGAQHALDDVRKALKGLF